MKTSTQSFTDKVISGLRNAATELEEFRLQLSLGKAEATDKYEEAKKRFNEILADVKTKIHAGKEKADELRGTLEDLQLQLALGKAETKDIFDEQKKRILQSVYQLEHELKKSAITAKLYSELSSEIEKFKIKLEILQLRFSLAKADVKEEFEAKKTEFLNKLNDLRRRYTQKEPEVKDNWDHFSKEITEAYDHLKKAFTKS